MRNWIISISVALCVPLISCAQTAQVRDLSDIQIEERRNIDGELLAKAWEHLQHSKEDRFFKNNSFGCYYFRQAKFDGKDVIYLTRKALYPDQCYRPLSYTILFDQSGNVSMCSSVIEHKATPCLN